MGVAPKQNNAYSHYSNYSYSGLIPNKRALKLILVNFLMDFILTLWQSQGYDNFQQKRFPIFPLTEITFFGFRRFYVTNRDLGNQLTIINTLCAKFKALWIAQSKEPYLPQYLYRLCSSYVTGDNPRRFIPVKV